MLVFQSHLALLYAGRYVGTSNVLAEQQLMANNQNEFPLNPMFVDIAGFQHHQEAEHKMSFLLPSTSSEINFQDA
jgi:hypothetical protein